jgi:hypothetical protein
MKYLVVCDSEQSCTLVEGKALQLFTRFGVEETS